MGNFSRHTNMVVIDGVSINKNARITICVLCAKTLYSNTSHCKCVRNQRICTSAGYWVKIKKKYMYKVMGHYRLVLYIRKMETGLKT